MNRLLLLGVSAILLGGATLSRGSGQANDANQPAKAPSLAKLLTDLKSSDDIVKLAALMGLADHGPKAEPALVDLLQALQSNNDDFRLNAAIALGKIGKPAVAELGKLLNRPDEDTRYYAIWALGWIGPDAKETAPAVIKSLADKSDAIRRKAAFTLGRIAPSAKVAVPALIEAFTDPSEDVRAAAVEAVGKFGAEAVPLLIDALKEKKAPQSIQAARALAEIGSEAKDAIPTLKTWLYSDGVWPQEASKTLGKIGKTAVPVLIEATKDSQAATRLAGINGLVGVGAEAVPDLVDALGNKHADVRRQAAAHLASQRINDKMVVLGLAYSLKDDDEQVRLSCVQGLQSLGLMAKLAMPKLREALVDGNFNVRAGAFYALGNMGENSRDAVLQLFKDKDLPLAKRVNAAALHLMMTRANDGVELLQQALKNQALDIRMQAAFALSQSGRATKDVVPIFIEGLQSKSGGVRLQAIQGLQSAGNRASEAAPVLLEIMQNDPDPMLKQQALHALQNVGGDAKVMLPALKKMLHDKDSDVRLSALQVVWRYGVDSIPLIVERFDDQDDNVKQNAIWMLNNVQGDLKAALPQIKVLLRHKNAQIRLGAVQLLGRCGEGGAEEMVTLLKSDDENLRWQAVYQLRNVQGAAKKLLPLLTEIAKTEKDVKMRTFGVVALAQLGPESYETLFALLKSEKDDGVRSAGIQQLANFGERSKAAIPYLIDLLKDKSAQVRTSATGALGNMGQAGKKAIPNIAELFQDADANVRMQAVYALANMTPDSLPTLAGGLKCDQSNVRLQVLYTLQGRNYHAKEIVPGLVGCLKDKNDHVRLVACQTLQRMGKDAADAVDALRETLGNDSNPQVRTAAQAVLDNLGAKK